MAERWTGCCTVRQGALSMGYFDGSALPLFNLAREYTRS